MLITFCHNFDSSDQILIKIITLHRCHILVSNARKHEREIDFVLLFTSFMSITEISLTKQMHMQKVGCFITWPRKCLYLHDLKLLRQVYWYATCTVSIPASRNHH